MLLSEAKCSSPIGFGSCPSSRNCKVLSGSCKNLLLAAKKKAQPVQHIITLAEEIGVQGRFAMTRQEVLCQRLSGPSCTACRTLQAHNTFVTHRSGSLNTAVVSSSPHQGCLVDGTPLQSINSKVMPCTETGQGSGDGRGGGGGGADREAGTACCAKPDLSCVLLHC